MWNCAGTRAAICGAAVELFPPMDVEPATDQGQVHSELIAYEGRDGRRIVAYIDACARELEGRPFVLMAPKYGETKKNNLHLAYYLAANGFVVLRFDLTNHIGESDGEMPDFTLPGAVQDILSSLDFLERRFGADDVILVASSLSARCALRAAALDPRIARLVCLVGVVNLQHTLREIYLEDPIERYIGGQVYGVTDFLGFDINGVTFLGSAVESRMHDLAGTRRDVEGIEVPVTYLYAERDLWVDAAEVRSVFGDRSNCRLVPVVGAMHEVRENPGAAEQAYRQAVLACLGKMDTDAAIVVPDKRLVLAQNRRERERLRAALPETLDETGFWSRYLRRYALMEKADVYRDYLNQVGALLGAFDPGCRVLDAGCGNGLFGLWLWLRLQQETSPRAALPATYVGIDLTARGLADSVRRHAGAVCDDVWPDAGGPTGRGLDYSYLRMDFDSLQPGDPAQGLPFADGTFDKACCSLVVSYLEQPARLFTELHRVLRPGGVLVVSSMKPFCDLSALYRDFVVQQAGEEDLERARGLLRAAGQIKLKEEKGNYNFYLGRELAELAAQAGFHEPEERSSLGNQANVVRVVK